MFRNGDLIGRWAVTLPTNDSCLTHLQLLRHIHSLYTSSSEQTVTILYKLTSPCVHSRGCAPRRGSAGCPTPAPSYCSPREPGSPGPPPPSRSHVCRSPGLITRSAGSREERASAERRSLPRQPIRGQSDNVRRIRAFSYRTNH